MENFEKILNSLSSAISILDSDGDAGSKLEREITARDHMYTTLLYDYVTISRRRNIAKEIHKWIFFWLIVLASVVGFVYIGKIVGRFMALKESEELLASIPVLITSLVSLISTIIVIPATITKFLFNTKEDDNITSVITHTQEHDAAGIKLLKHRFAKQQKQVTSASNPNGTVINTSNSDTI